jgi:hypothetical protein
VSIEERNVRLRVTVFVPRLVLIVFAFISSLAASTVALGDNGQEDDFTDEIRPPCSHEQLTHHPLYLLGEAHFMDHSVQTTSLLINRAIRNQAIYLYEELRSLNANDEKIRMLHTEDTGISTNVQDPNLDNIVALNPYPIIDLFAMTEMALKEPDIQPEIFEVFASGPARKLLIAELKRQNANELVEYAQYVGTRYLSEYELAAGRSHDLKMTSFRVQNAARFGSFFLAADRSWYSEFHTHFHGQSEDLKNIKPYYQLNKFERGITFVTNHFADIGNDPFVSFFRSAIFTQSILNTMCESKPNHPIFVQVGQGHLDKMKTDLAAAGVIPTRVFDIRVDAEFEDLFNLLRALDP